MRETEVAQSDAALSPTPDSNPDLTGIAGWLIFIAIGQLIAPVRIIWTLALYYQETSTILALQQFPATVYGEGLLNFTYVVIIFAATFTFFSRRRIFKSLFVIEVLAGLLITPLIYAWVSLTTGISFRALTTGTLEFSQTITAGVAAAAWVPYIWWSKRVKNTFVK